MSRAGAKAKRAAQRQVSVRTECPSCHLGVLHHIRQAEPSRLSYVDLHALVCGCTPNQTGDSYCHFGDGWLDAA